MMDAASLIERLDSLGISMTLEGEKLIARPKDRVPTDLIPVLKKHKPDLVQYLRRRGCQQDFHGAGPGQNELQELVRRVKAERYVLCWSEVLQDLVPFHGDDLDPSTIPPGFTAYSEQELCHLFDGNGDPLSKNALRLVHDAKTTGAKVIGVDEDNEAKE